MLDAQAGSVTNREPKPLLKVQIGFLHQFKTIECYFRAPFSACLSSIPIERISK